MPWVLRGLRNGIVTTGWPRRTDPYFADYPAAVHVESHRDDDRAAIAAAASECPTAAISTRPRVLVDRGRCILCGRCVRLAPNVFRHAAGAGTASLTRTGLVVGAAPESDQALAELRAALGRRVRRLRRSVHIRHVDTGSDGSDEWEVAALANPVYDVHRLGIFFTSSPRHADILLVTGIGTAGMVEPLLRTYQAMPAPTVVVAAGADAASGGLIGGGYTGGTGVGELVPIDVWVPGSPATPFSLLHGILLGLGRVPVPSEVSR